MEGKKHILITMLMLQSILVFGQNNESIYNAYRSGDMHKWRYAMDSIEAVKQKTDQELLDLINYQYGYIAWCIGNKKNHEAKKYLKKATDNLEKLEPKKYKTSMLYAYRAAFVGFEIGLALYKAPFIGPKSLEYAQKSIRTDTLNAIGYIQLGNIAYYTPAILGGSKNEALAHYLKALKIMEASSEFKTNNWNYLNLLATLISAYMDLNQYETSKHYCLKTLAIEPGFDWVRNNLYPQVIKKLKR